MLKTLPCKSKHRQTKCCRQIYLERGRERDAFRDYKHCRPICVRIRRSSKDSLLLTHSGVLMRYSKSVSCCRVCGAAWPNGQNITFDVTRIDSYLLTRDWPIHFATHDVAEPTVTLARYINAIIIIIVIIFTAATVEGFEEPLLAGPPKTGHVASISKLQLLIIIFSVVHD